MLIAELADPIPKDELPVNPVPGPRRKPHSLLLEEWCSLLVICTYICMFVNSNTYVCVFVLYNFLLHKQSKNEKKGSHLGLKKDPEDN